ncbi:MAG TPA: sugar transferase [Thermodesulfobacteriota bacterium]|jgi:lipopolysaccharide/colanic/teichoic acid biosynthesis glycosyltransferase|nr:sugar transferase [Thermodesulfobacteriota bacterium]
MHIHERERLEAEDESGQTGLHHPCSSGQSDGRLEPSLSIKGFPLKLRYLEGEIHRSNGWHSIGKTHPKGRTREEYLLKRILDIVLSSLGIVVCLPISIIIAIAIWIEDRGPIFYCSERVGKHGRFFKTFKFRTMIPDSDVRFGPLQAKENDHRITGVGRVLRATAMDEIPQLLNVLKGDMSMVGPRALLPAEIEVKGHSSNGSSVPVPLKKIPGYWERHSVKPGLTGLAQIFAPRDVTRKQKFRYDLIYVRRQSLWLDVKFLALSFWITLGGKWESRGRKF